MQVPAALLDEAVKRSGISLEQLTDTKLLSAIDWRQQFPGLSVTELAEVSRIPNEGTYETLAASISSVLAYAAGNWDGGLDAVVEDCENSDDMAKFMPVVLDILLERPDMFADATGITLDVAKLTEIRRYI